MMDFTRQDIFFDGDGVKLHGWLYRPTEEAAESESPRPPPARAAILLSHGFTALMELGLDDYAQAFTAAGFVCLVYDHRNWGKSEGFPRHETHPWVQVEDMRAALSFLRTLPGVDPACIGLWGTSYSGGHAITVAALDRRVRCVVAQVPLVSGERTFASWVPADRRASFMERLSADRDARARGEPAVITRPAPSGSETEEWARAVDRAGV
ncbi:MAG: CocE/NonD family hydrolase, partial [Alphaproteobacteria bacterium]